MSELQPTPWFQDEDVAHSAEAIFAEYDLANATTPELLLDRVTAAGGKPITIQKTSNPALRQTTALWVEYDQHSKILLRNSDRPYYQTRALHHEFAHILFQHPACTGLSEIPDPIGGRVRGRILVTPDEFSASSGLHRYEGEAECLATLITQNLLRPLYLDDDRLFG